MFTPGKRVLYIPNHAHGDRNHKDCEWGTISSINEKYVFVRFDSNVSHLGWDGATSQACNPDNLQIG